MAVVTASTELLRRARARRAHVLHSALVGCGHPRVGRPQFGCGLASRVPRSCYTKSHEPAPLRHCCCAASTCLLCPDGAAPVQDRGRCRAHVRAPLGLCATVLPALQERVKPGPGCGCRAALLPRCRAVSRMRHQCDVTRPCRIAPSPSLPLLHAKPPRPGFTYCVVTRTCPTDVATWLVDPGSRWRLYAPLPRFAR
jgi:hypothetical protein